MINIITGWFNLLFNLNNRLAIYRAKKCILCKKSTLGWHESIVSDKIKEIQGLVCSLCNCPLSAKLRSKNSECPLNKW